MSKENFGNEDARTEYEYEFNNFADEAAGAGFEAEKDYSQQKKGGAFGQAEEEDKEPAYMLFDFRGGSTRWPEKAELVSPEDAEQAIQKKKDQVAKESAKSSNVNTSSVSGGPQAKDKVGGVSGKKMEGFGGGENNNYDVMYPSSFGMGDSSDSESDDEVAGVFTDENGVEHKVKPGAPLKDSSENLAPSSARYETLKDGSTALVMDAGWRLKLDLNDMTKGGDAKKEERKKEAEKKAKDAAKRKKAADKRAAAGGWGGWGGGGGGGDYKYEKYYKDVLPEWTVTMDIKLGGEPPREGVSLVHTALIHAEESKGRTKLKPTEGEAVINCDGGVGQLGTFGDVSKARVIPGQWHRVVISVKVATSEKQKGELRTWVDTKPGCVLKSEAVMSGGRFELDLDSLYLFSSNDPMMMPGGVSIRTVRVQQGFATDKLVKEGRARDKVFSMQEEEKRRKVDEQRRGLALADLFAKPRPVWSTPALVATFGDAFIEGTPFEGSSCLAWSFTVLNHALQNMLRSSLADTYLVGLNQKARGTVSDVMHVLNKSATMFKHMARLLKNPNTAQLMGFLRKIKKAVGKVSVGETLLLPAIVENTELLLLLVRKSDKYFDLVVVATDPSLPLMHHPVNAAKGGPAIHFRTCMVVGDIDKKSMLCDVFWSALFNLTARSTAKDSTGDMKRFYELLIPFVTGKPLEQTLIDVETKASESKDGGEGDGSVGPWRLPQKSSTSYVKCIFEALNFLLTSRGLSQIASDQVQLSLMAQLIDYVSNDLMYLAPDENGRRVCEMALSSFSDATVKLSEAHEEHVKMMECSNPECMSSEEELKLAKEGLDEARKANELFRSKVPEATRHRVLTLASDLAACAEDEEDLPAPLDLIGAPEDKCFDEKDPHAMQFKDHLCWETEDNIPDPGQAVTLRKYDPVDLLQIPEKANTREEAINAIRLTDRQCTKIFNQTHCMKNPKHLIATLIEHLFTQVLDVPKPRAVPSQDAKREARAAAALARREERETKEKKEKAARASKWHDFKSGKKEAQSKAGASSSNSLEKGEQKDEVSAAAVEASNELVDMENQLLERSVGEQAELEATSASCYWDAPINYELQVEILLTLNRLLESFAASALSIQHNRSFDAVCTVVPGVIMAISDAVLRRLATDRPSELSGILMGMTADGRQLGISGFGTSVSTFAEQTETMEIHCPELSVARTAVLDYFQSPQQKRLEKIFDWESNFVLAPTRSLIKMIRHLCRSIAFADARPHMLLTDRYPESSLLMKNYPELRAYRDIAMWWKFFLNADVSVFPNYSDPSNPRDINEVARMSAQLKFDWNNEERGYQVTILDGGLIVRCRPDPKKTDPVTGRIIPPEKLPRNRYPSTATPSFHLKGKPVVKTEDDVIYRPNLPSFDEGHGQILNQRDSELLFSYLTVPYLRLPLVLAFFSHDDRVHKLQSLPLKEILDSVAFEPGKYLVLGDTGVFPAMVPTQHPGLLSSAYGLMMNELHRSPANVLEPTISLISGALALDTGAVCDVGGKDFNTGVDIILYVTRFAARVENYISFLVDHKRGLHRCIDAPLREVELDEDTLKVLLEGQKSIRGKLHGEVAPLIEEYLLKLDKETSSNPNNEKLIDRNSRLACDLHAHRLLLYRNFQQNEMTPLSSKVLIGSFVYLTTRHTWNKAARKQGKLLLPETELYELLTVVRRRLITWPSFKRQSQLDEVLQTALQVSSSTTGSLRASAAIVDAANRWSVIAGVHSVGRFAVASTRTVSNTNDEEGKGKAPTKALTLERHVSDEVGEVADTGLLGVEMDLQIGQMTLRSKHLQALESNIANHPDVKHLFGDSTMQASLLERAEHRSRFRLVGLGHDLEYWPSAHVDLPPLSDQWEREYDPAELGEDEIWISKLFEPVRKNFFDGPNPPPMQFMMPERAISKTAEVVMLIGLHQALGGPFKVVMLFRRLKCVHVYECVTQGRQWWYTLHMTTDARFTLREMQPSTGDRQNPYPKWWENGAGSPYPRGVAGSIFNDIIGISTNPAASVLIKRDASDPRNLSGGVETYVPSRLMLGVVPQSLLDEYDFFQDESTEPITLQPGTGRPGYKKLRGYPVSEKEDTILFVEFQPIGSWEEELASVIPTSSTDSLSVAVTPKNSADRHWRMEVTGLPGRSVRIMRRRKVVVAAEIAAVKAVASELERLKLLAPPSKKKAKQTQVLSEVKVSYEVGAVLEFDTDGTGTKWVNAEILKVHPDGETYDIDPSESWVGRQLRVPSVFLRKIGSVAVKEGLGVWVYDGLSDSEDEDWRDDDDDEDEDANKQKKDDAHKHAVCFAHLDRLGPLLEVTGWDEGICISILRKVGAVSGANPFTSVDKLIAVVKIEVEAHFQELVDKNLKALEVKNSSAPGAHGEDLELLNLLGAPRRSRLHSLMKTLVRIENLGFILAWTASTRHVLKSTNMEFAAAFGCPPITTVELPRLKLAFKCRPDFNGDLRLYSLDHSDLFISNVRLPAVNQMLRGIPHSLVLSNLKGELQVLVPVLCTPRPKVGSQPFTTQLVLDREKKEWYAGLSSRYYMYPVHVSTSFLLTKGLNSAMYLMLLRFLHRDYEDVYRLSDSVATDTALNTEGGLIFQALRYANNDGHPDAHACRLKISLVVSDSGSVLPWDLTVEFAKYLIKLDQTATTCLMSKEEELQLLETDKVVYDESHKDYDFLIHTAYYMTLVKNRLHSLRAVLGEGGMGLAITAGEGGEDGMGPQKQDCNVFHPPREIGSQWCYYQDNTALGQVYSKTHEIDSQSEWDSTLEGPLIPNHETSFGKWIAIRNYISLMSENDKSDMIAQMIAEGEAKEDKNTNQVVLAQDIFDNFELQEVDTHPVMAKILASSEGLVGWFNHEHGIKGGRPSGGFLSVIVFQVLWDPDCTKVIPSIEELAPSFSSVKFCLLRADRVGVDNIARERKVLSFPTVLVMRGKEELARIEGYERTVGRLVEILKENITPADTHVATALQDYEMEQSGEVEEVEEEEELQWTWDPEYASESIKVVNYGTVIALAKDDEEEAGELGKWQYQSNNQYNNSAEEWEDFDESLSMMLERDYRSGRFFLERSMTAVGPDDGVSVRMGDVKITHDMVTGLHSTFSSNPYSEFPARRKGPRFQVDGDEKYTSEAQKASDKFERQWKENMKARKLERAEENVGKDLEGVRGTNSFFEESGVYRWTCKWNHEPARGGGADAVGICSDVAEYFGPLAFPVLGYRGGHSLGLYADGTLVFDHKEIAKLKGPPRKEVTEESSTAAIADGLNGDSDDEGGGTVNLPRCYNKHPWQEMATPSVYCQRCYTHGEMPYFCGFCNDGFCQNCYDQEFLKLNPTETPAAPAEGVVKEEEEDEEEDEEELDRLHDEFYEKAEEMGKTEEEVDKMVEDQEAELGKNDYMKLIQSLSGAAEPATAEQTSDEGKKFKLEDFLPPEPDVVKAPLFGKGSRVTIILDTGTDGGTLSFEVDGEPLVAEDGTKSLNKIYERMGCSQIFPAVCMCPFDPLPPMPECEAPENTEKQSKKKSKALDNDEEEAKEAEREKKRIDARECADLARKCRRPFEEINKLEPPVRAQLASMVDQLLRRRVPHIQLIIGDDEEAAVNKAKAEEEALAAAEKAEKEKGAEGGEEQPAGDGLAPTSDVPIEGGPTMDMPPTPAAGATDETPQEEPGDEPMDRIVWMYETTEGWIPHSKELSITIEEALREGRSEVSANVGVELMTIKMTKGTDGKGPCQSSEEGNSQRIRRHVVGPGLQGEWEMLSLRFSPPMSMYGQAALGILEKCWESSEEMSGRTHGLGFLFLYNMMQGSTRVSCITGGGGSNYSYGGKGGNNNAHRFAVLLSQLYSDKNKRSLMGSVANVLSQNRHICVRMPKLKDTRKSRQSPVYNGWCDEAEPRSPVAELFSKLVPAMQRLKRQRGALRYPPKPPYPEMPVLPSRRLAVDALREVEIPPSLSPVSSGGPSSLSSASTVSSSGEVPPAAPIKGRAVLGDTSCSSKTVESISPDEISALATEVRYNLTYDPKNNGNNAIVVPKGPLKCEDGEAFDQLTEACAEADQILVVAFCATWCGACGQLSPIFRKLSIQIKAATFAKVDVDEADEVARLFKIKSLPTVLIFRGGGKPSNVVGKIEGGGIGFVPHFLDMLKGIATQKDMELMMMSNKMGPPSAVACQKISVDAEKLQALACNPLEELAPYFVSSTRADRGLEPLGGDCSALDAVEGHDAARTAVASSMLRRMKQDVKAHAEGANKVKTPKVKGLDDASLLNFFNGSENSEEALKVARETVVQALAKLTEIRDDDSYAISATVPLLKHAANYVEIDKFAQGSPAHLERVAYQLKRFARQAPLIWMEFLFGSTLSTTGDSDVLNVNPYLSETSLALVNKLLIVTMLKANRVGHANRCIGAAVSLLSLVDAALATAPGQGRTKAASTLLPKLAQASGDLGGGLASERYFVDQQTGGSSGALVFDPRFLLFEFVWNILLREKQVITVRNFVKTLQGGGSKVKQMIMGAGKTTVVAPLLALMLADGDSLVLSVVPKALLEMSRKQMRETFSTIMSKRIYTLNFDRGTVITPATHRGLVNAKKNRGVVVATPTTLKSIQLVYVETIQRLDNARKVGPKDAVVQLSAQLLELKNVLQTFRESVLLLDEVDMVLHPLKSELNFPIGEKYDLDGAEQGERWSLPTHLVDALFFTQCGRATTFENSGLALEILGRLNQEVKNGFEKSSLQRLPHLTLLDTTFYHERLKPVLAEWAFLWLQKQHLHGIDRNEAIQYILEGAVARSDLAMKVNLIDGAVTMCDVDLGNAKMEPELTRGHQRSLSISMKASDVEAVGANDDFDDLPPPPSSETLRLVRQTTHDEYKDGHHAHNAAVEKECLMTARAAAEEQRALIGEIFSVEKNLEEHLGKVKARSIEIAAEVASLEAEVVELEAPRDDSLDNATVVWVSLAFAGQQASGDMMDEDESQSASNKGASSVHSVVTVLEDSGLTVRRCGDPYEAIDRARDLFLSKRLRCVVFGGGESSNGCGPSCSKNHRRDGRCLVCGMSSGSPYHRGHNCLASGYKGQRGSWKVSSRRSSTSASLSMEASEFFTQLTDLEDPFAKLHGALPVDRCALWGGNSAAKQELRTELWNLGVCVRETPSDLCDWVDSMKPWEAPEDEAKAQEEEEDDFDLDAPPDSGPALMKQVSAGTERLDECRNRLVALEKEQALLESSDEDSRKAMAARARGHFDKLAASVETRRINLEKASHAILDVLKCQASDITNSGFSGPRSGRDAALAEAWFISFKNNRANTGTEDKELTTSERRRLIRAHRWMKGELIGLQQVLLAAKVVALISSPEQIKYLNLTHDWLRTFLPHCLQKVNRVSFGLLSSEECAETLEDDPMVPRSRLALAVPFIGKDVPSKSSEFAHPDITIGLTVMAYRYSGLRENDFNDLIDSLTTDFSHEIGPARERPSSLRYESWVAAAGGKVRGVVQQKQDIPAAAIDIAAPPIISEESKAKALEDGDMEVVQLKFLQKSNAEQMNKLNNLWVLEPLVLHYYLNKFIFPEHMRTQRSKLSASGQSVGGDMLVRRRVGFSGTPSDLLPREMGACEYETGDDGKMLTTVLDPAVMSYELLGNGWSVEKLLERVATASPRFHSLIDTGALITGYSNEQVASELLKRGLTWCDGVVFLDGQDKQQVLVRATGRVTSADQCGVPLERRFAFYDQIHTTGMDVKHVVNATAVITLGKDMVFRDYVQGAYRMRGIGQGQKIHVFVIPEVQELMQREREAALKKPVNEDGGEGPPHAPGDELALTVGNTTNASATVGDVENNNNPDMLKHIVAWLVVNSMRSEQTQWSMLCIQNVGNIYRKTAFDVMMSGSKKLTEDASAMDVALDSNSPDPRMQLTPRISLGVFEEEIDFSLEAAVPDPLPFEAKLRALLDDHEQFIIGTEAHDVGADVLREVGKFSILDGSENKLETEQEREQEQEQQKEVKARRDQQVEIEKFVDREYSRNEERPTPWPLQALLRAPPSSTKNKKDGDVDDHPFYPLREFALRHQESLEMPLSTYCSRNYFNPNWSGLRRIKNVVMVIEWSPNAEDDLRLYSADEQEALSLEVTQMREAALTKAFSMLSAGGQTMNAQQARNMVKAATDCDCDTEQLVELISNAMQKKCADGSGLDLDGLRKLLKTGAMHPTHKGRYYVCVSLAEAETLRRVLHVRKSKAVVEGGKTEVALRYSPVASPGAEKVGDGGIAFDASLGWRVSCENAEMAPVCIGGVTTMVRKVVKTGATRSEASSAHNSLRFFDGDMHYPTAALQVLVRSLQRSSCLERERFFAATVGVRRRMDRKWQETPLSSVFTTNDEFAALKQRAQSVFVREALKSRDLRKWEAFTSFDSDDNGLLGPAEVYGALRWLGMPGLNADDVIDFVESGDKKRDGFLNYKEFNDLLKDGDEDDEDEEEEEVKEDKKEDKEKSEEESIPKIEAYGGDEVREVILRRKREELEKQREDRARREAYAAELDRRIFEEELKASASRAGGANPAKFDLTNNKVYAGDEEPAKDAVIATEYRFTSNSPPLRTVIVGKTALFTPVLGDVLRKKAAQQPLCCPRGHEICKMGYFDRYTRCRACKRNGVQHYCPQMYSWSSYGTPCQGYVLCDRCVKNHTEDKLRAAADPRKHETCMAAEAGTSLSLMVPTDAVVSEPFKASQSTPQEKILAAAASAALSGVRLGLSYTISVEILMSLLPPRGQRSALMRFSPPPTAVGRAAKRQHASLYVTNTGEIGGPSFEVDDHRRALHRKRALVLMAGLRCALKLSKAAKAVSEANNTKKTEYEAKIAEKAAAEAKIAEEKAAAEAKIAEEKAATEAKAAEEKGSEEKGTEKAEVKDSADSDSEDSETESEVEPDTDEEAIAQAKEDEKRKAEEEAKLQAEAKASEPVYEVPGLPKLETSEGKLAILAHAWRKLCGRSVVRLKQNTWHAVTIVIDGGATPPSSAVYIDGLKTPTNLVPKTYSDEMSEEILTLLGLGRRIVLFGGGKQAESRGGSIRRLRLTDGTLTPSMIRKEHLLDLPAANPLTKRAATLIQTRYRIQLAKAKVLKMAEVVVDPEELAKHLREETEERRAARAERRARKEEQVARRKERESLREVRRGEPTSQNHEYTLSTFKLDQTPRKKTPYMVFMLRHRSRVQSENPGMSMIGVSKELGRQWKALTPQEQKGYFES